MSMTVLKVFASLPLLSNALYMRQQCSPIMDRALCTERLPDWVAKTIGGFKEKDLDCIGYLCHKKSKEKCCDVITALGNSPFMKEVLTDGEESAIKTQDKLKSFMDKYGKQSPLSPQKDVEEENPIEPETTTPAAKPSSGLAPTISKLPAGCSKLKARFLCQEHRPSWVFNKIGSLGDNDLDCIGSLCYFGEGNDNCCKVLGALAESPMILDKQMGDEIFKQQRMQDFLTKFPPVN